MMLPFRNIPETNPSPISCGSFSGPLLLRWWRGVVYSSQEQDERAIPGCGVVVVALVGGEAEEHGKGGGTEEGDDSEEEASVEGRRDTEGDGLELGREDEERCRILCLLFMEEESLDDFVVPEKREVQLVELGAVGRCEEGDLGLSGDDGEGIVAESDYVPRRRVGPGRRSPREPAAPAGLGVDQGRRSAADGEEDILLLLLVVVGGGLLCLVLSFVASRSLEEEDGGGLDEGVDVEDGVAEHGAAIDAAEVGPLGVDDDGGRGERRSSRERRSMSPLEGELVVDGGVVAEGDLEGVPRGRRETPDADGGAGRQFSTVAAPRGRRRRVDGRDDSRPVHDHRSRRQVRLEDTVGAERRHAPPRPNDDPPGGRRVRPVLPEYFDDRGGSGPRRHVDDVDDTVNHRKHPLVVVGRRGPEPRIGRPAVRRFGLRPSGRGVGQES
mmetsp:Transcript_27375/g.88417  ORF Transcript_27375/g.88417 Transcript_27375/m.88417 type:complete len:440 (+) Transcript_27375:1121-2440(+)